MIAGFPEETFQEDKPQCGSIYQVSAHIMLANILLTKAGHMAKPRGLNKGVNTGHHGSRRATWLIDSYVIYINYVHLQA